MEIAAPRDKTATAQRFVAAALVACLALLALSAASSTAGPKRHFKGKTVQKRAVVLSVTAGRLELKRFTAHLRCADGSVLTVVESGFEPTPLRPGGKFADRQLGSTDTVLLKGKVGARLVRGKLRVTDRLGKRGRGARCDSRWIDFRAGRR